MSDAKGSFAEEVAQTFIERIREGTAPWQKPWKPGVIANAPYNPTTNRPYRGINQLLLTIQGRDDPRWMTYKQARGMDAFVRKGERASTIEYWQWTKTQKETGPDGQEREVTLRLERPRVFFAKVFNAEQIDGLEPLKELPQPSFDPIDNAERLLAGTKVPILHDQPDRAYYNSRSDEIHLPPQNAFKTAYDYYATALHEAGHATGHGSRLNRQFGTFGSELYAREELRAEISSYMMARELGIGHDPSNHASYVQGWLKALEENPREIFSAARDADRITTWIMQPEKRQELEKAAQERGRADDKAKEQTVIQDRDADRYYLNVPFVEKDAAKAAGARWDRAAKSWFAPASADRSALAAWDTISGAKPERTGKVLAPDVEFAAACKDHGLLLQGAPVMDGQWHRVAVEGDKGADKSGSYRAFMDGRPSGQMTNFKRGGAVQWVATGQALTPDLARALGEEAQAVTKARADDRAQAHAAAAKRAWGVWSNAPWLAGKHPYLEARGVKGWFLKTGNDGALMVPLRDAEGKLHSLQFIGEDGTKRMMTGGRKGGCFHLVDPEKRLGKEPLVIAEGYATAASIHEATGRPVAVAFDAGNLKPVAEALQSKYPQMSIVIAGDDDRRKDRNVGHDAALEAAKAVGGTVILPPFGEEDRAQGMTDFNDLARTRGREAVRAAIGGAVNRLQSREAGSELAMSA